MQAEELFSDEDIEMIKQVIDESLTTEEEYLELDRFDTEQEFEDLIYENPILHNIMSMYIHQDMEETHMLKKIIIELMKERNTLRNLYETAMSSQAFDETMFRQHY